MSGPLSLTFQGPGLWNGGPQGGVSDPQPLGSFTGTPDDIRGFVNSMWGQKADQPIQNKVQDLLTDAQHYGVSMDQLAGAYGMTPDQGAMAVYNAGVDPSRIYTPSYQGNFAAADQTQNPAPTAGSPAPTLSDAGVQQFQDFIDQQLGGGRDASGAYTGSHDFFAGGTFNPNAATGGLTQEQLLQKIAGAGTALGFTDQDFSKALDGAYTPDQVHAYLTDPNNAPFVGIDKGIFNTDEMFSRDPSAAPDYAAIYTPTQHFADGGSVPDWLQQVQQFGDLSNLPPDLWAQIQGFDPSSASNAGWDYNGYHINPEVSRSASLESGSGPTLEGFSVTPDGQTAAGQRYMQYNPNGSLSGAQTINADNSVGDFLTFLGGAMGIAALPMAFGGAFGGAIGDAAGAGLGAELGANGAFLGEGVASGIPAWDAAATGAGLDLGAAGAAAGDYVNGSDLMSDSFDSAGGMGAGGFGGGTGSLAGAGDYVNGSDIMSDNFDASGSHGAGGFTGAGTGVGAGAGSGAGTGTGGGGSGSGGGTGSGLGTGLGGLSNSDWLKLIGGLSSLTGGGGSSSSATTPPPPSVDANYSISTPGWRTDRPMYVPGQDAIPEGWFGAGHTS